MKFVVVYENKPAFKGMDRYFVSVDSSCWHVENAKRFDTREEAESIVRDYPVIDDAHEAAKVVRKSDD